MRKIFDNAARHLDALVRPGEVYLASFRGETSDFARFNRSALRQVGSVREVGLSLDLIEGRRHAEVHLVLTGDEAEDARRLERAVADAREGRKDSDEDPHLLFNTDVHSGERHRKGKLPKRDAAIEAVLDAGKGRDLVGIYAAGTMASGFANSLGQRNWDEIESFNLDWSFYLGGDKAVKAEYAGFDWSDAALAHAAEAAARQLEPLSRPPRALPPGEYRAYLAPAAVKELLGMLSWGGFGLAAHRTRATVFLRMIEGGAALNSKVTLTEATAEGACPAFGREGFVRPPRVELVREGRYRDCLVSPRSGVEYGVANNGANGGETPMALDMAPGGLPEAGALKALGTGVYVSNLWYCNFSDRSAGRLTGMTRFASFWVEDGELVAPLNVMRFDDTIYRMLGENLIDLTEERAYILDNSTYDGRSSESMHVPGALLGAMRFTL